MQDLPFIMACFISKQEREDTSKDISIETN